MTGPEHSQNPDYPPRNTEQVAQLLKHRMLTEGVEEDGGARRWLYHDIDENMELVIIDSNTWEGQQHKNVPPPDRFTGLKINKEAFYNSANTPIFLADIRREGSWSGMRVFVYRPSETTDNWLPKKCLADPEGTSVVISDYEEEFTLDSKHPVVEELVKFLSL